MHDDYPSGMSTHLKSNAWLDERSKSSERYEEVVYRMHALFLKKAASEGSISPPCLPLGMVGWRWGSAGPCSRACSYAVRSAAAAAATIVPMQRATACETLRIATAGLAAIVTVLVGQIDAGLVSLDPELARLPRGSRLDELLDELAPNRHCTKARQKDLRKKG